MDTQDTLLTFLQEFKKETKEDLAALRKSNHDINNELHGVNGQLQLLRQAQETQKEDMDSKFDRVHKRIDKEQADVKEEVHEVKKSLESIVSTLNEVTPKVKSWDDTLKIAKKVIITAVTVAVLGLITSKMAGLI